MEVKDSTSAAVGSESAGSVFDVTIDGYGRLRARAEDFTIQALKGNLSSSMRHYLTRAQWTTVGDVPSVLNVTAELDQPLQVSRTWLTLPFPSPHCVNTNAESAIRGQKNTLHSCRRHCLPSSVVVCCVT